ncbi:MAG: PH domain-containing protein [Anaerolineae bacterium]|nr:PH domain-containing protein [Anaerolineae bacterium]
MTEWKTQKTQGLIIGSGLILVIILIDAGLIWVAIERPLTIGTFILGLAVLTSLFLLMLIGYWLYGLARSKYLLDRNALIIRWGAVEQIIPAPQIQRVLTGEEIEGPIRFYGGMWPGHWVGYGEVSGIGQTLFYATVPPRAQVFIVTPGLSYGISPADRDNFLASLRKRLEMGPTQLVEQGSRLPGFVHWAIWRDRLGLGMLLTSLVLLLALVGLLCFYFPALPRVVPLHFGVDGNPDRLGARSGIFIVPLIGLLALLFNGSLGALAYRRERMVSYLLWGGALLVQLLTWRAALGIIAQAG